MYIMTYIFSASAGGKFDDYVQLFPHLLHRCPSSGIYNKGTVSQKVVKIFVFPTSIRCKMVQSGKYKSVIF